MLNENHNSQEEFKPGFWQRPFIQETLPFITSLVLHLSLIAIGLATMQALKVVVFNPNRTTDFLPGCPVPPDDPNQKLPPILPGDYGDSDRPRAQDKLPDVPKEARGTGEKLSPMRAVSFPSGGSLGDTDTAGQAWIGIGPPIGKGRGRGAGIGDGFGDGNGDDGVPHFGLPSTGLPGPPRVFERDPARRIAYVCDASGSMLNMFDALRMEIRRSVDLLRPIQSFNLYFFQAEGVKVVDANNLMPAIPSSKQKAFDFMDKLSAASETNPIPALELAFKHRVEFIYLLTDGDFNGPGNDAVVRYCAQRTRDGKTRINTIAYIGKDAKDNPQDLEFVKALQAIAKDSGGKFRFVTDDDMGK